MGGSSSKTFDSSKSLFVEVKPIYKLESKSESNSKINDKEKLNFFKNKLDKNYLFGVDDYNYKIINVRLNDVGRNGSGRTILYEIKYKLKKNKSEKTLGELEEYIKDAFHKETHAGDENKINKNTYVLINAKNVKIYQ